MSSTTIYINIFHRVAIKNPKLIKGVNRLIATSVLDPDEVDEDGVVDDEGDALNEEYEGD